MDCPGVNCGLRDAIAKAAPGDTITFGFGGGVTNLLTDSKLDINKSLTSMVNGPAIDASNPATPGSGGNACPLHDQRDYPRGGAAGRCDIGSFERVFFEYLPILVR